MSLGNVTLSTLGRGPYDIGDVERISGAFVNSSGVATDPTTVIFKIRVGTTETDYTYGVDTAVVKDSTGNYHIDYRFLQGGTHWVRWVGTNVVDTAAEEPLDVKYSVFTAPLSALTPPAGPPANELGVAYLSGGLTLFSGSVKMADAAGSALAFGSDPADTGAIRLSNGSANGIYAESSPAGTDIPLLHLDSAEIIIVGGTTEPAGIRLRTNTGSVAIQIGAGLAGLSVTSTSADFSTLGASGEILLPRFLTWNDDVVSPQISQNDDTGASATGETLVIRAQNATGTTSVGGTLDLKSGTGTSSNGPLRLRNGSLQAGRFVWDVVTGECQFGVGIDAEGTASIRVGSSRNADGASAVHLSADTTWGDAATSLSRNSGTNGSLVLSNRGTGDLNITAVEAATIKLNATNALQVAITDGLVNCQDCEIRTSGFFSLNNDVTIRYGTGSPESSVAANDGSLYHQTNATHSPLWIKASGTGNTGWHQATTHGTAAATVSSGFWTLPAGALGTITVCTITGEGSASDTLDTINGGVTGQILILQTVDSAQDITLSEAGNLKLNGGSQVLDNVEDKVMLIKDAGGNWHQIAPISNNGA